MTEGEEKRAPDEPEWPEITPVIQMRAILCGAAGGAAGAGFALWLALSHRTPPASAGVLAVGLTLGGASLAAGFYLWWQTARRWPR